MDASLKAVELSPNNIRVVSLSGSVKAELNQWREVLAAGLKNPDYWRIPAWLVADRVEGWQHVEVFTDAATSVGGGYVVPGRCFARWKWSAEELQKANEVAAPVDINILEFVTVVLMIVREAEYFRGKVVVCRVDNTAAVAWLNSLKTKHSWGQSWIRLLFQVCVDYNIRIYAKHIPGIMNEVADHLSRFYQEVFQRLLRDGLSQSYVAGRAWRERMWKVSARDGWTEVFRSLRVMRLELESTI
jgi:hypothetical protein